MDSAGELVDPNMGPVDGTNVESVALGQWFWVKEVVRWDGEHGDLPKGSEYEWLGCVMAVGTNFVEVHSPHGERGYSTTRVHFDKFWDQLRPEPDAERYIAEQIEHYRAKTQALMNQVRELTARLGVAPMTAITTDQAHGAGPSALAVMSSEVDVKAYETSLVLAKTKTLPDLFAAIKATNQQLATWMLATVMPAKASMAPLEGTIGQINDRIFNISLYAGLTETAIQCCDGEPAPMGEKLRVMQRRLYMDEECLLNYQTGGMTFQNASEFDAWISKPENRDRILPFPRCVVAMRVRRNDKDYEFRSLMSAFVNMQLAQADELTFLYVRNGEQVWCIQTEQQFGELIFPDASVFDQSEPKVAEMFGRSVRKIISKREYDERLAEHLRKQALADAWDAANPDVKNKGFHNPHRSRFRDDEYAPFDPSSVYYDDCVKRIAEEIKAYNRVAMIIQGLFDRSPVLHPHPPVQTWTQRGFENAVELIYDSSNALYAGDKPNFETYRKILNALITPDSVMVGQETKWMKVEAERENKRINERHRHSDHVSEMRRYRPQGDPGPGAVARMAQWKPRARQAVFTWEKLHPWRGTITKKVLTVDADELLNVSAYTPGDYKQFFRDPRTRGEYLKWAPYLLAAEEYHAGVLKAQEPLDG